MKITFEGSLASVLDEIEAFLDIHRVTTQAVLASRDTAEPEPVAEVEQPEPKKKSKRKGNPTLLDLAKVTDPDGSIAAVIELLDETNDTVAVQAPVEAAEEPSGITDADLSKAASHAAGKITPAGVKEILGEYGAGRVQELASSVRQSFLDDLKEATAK